MKAEQLLAYVSCFSVLNMADAMVSNTPGALTGTSTSPLHLLTSPPEVLREYYGWEELQHADKAHAVWACLRKGLDVLVEHECMRTKHASPRLHRQLLDSNCAPVSPVTLSSSSISEDETQKLLITLSDGLSVECVIIPMPGRRHSSLCVSSQVGCSRGCAFCSTGTMGLIRSLSAEEILAQVWIALRVVRQHDLPPLVNVVFMGMCAPPPHKPLVPYLGGRAYSPCTGALLALRGEPLNNFEAVSKAVDMLVHPKAFALSRRNVCVSTVGPSPHLIAKAGKLPCRLAWSVHAADDELRKLLVPTSLHSMSELRDAFRAALANKPGGDKSKGLLVELALMGGVNDQLEHAEQLRHLLHPFGRNEVLVNLIPYNENGLELQGKLFRAPHMQDVYKFQRHLWDAGILCTVRATRGDKERSACGQLATEVSASWTRNRRPKSATPSME